MPCLLEIYSERKIFQYLMKSTPSNQNHAHNTRGSTNQMLVVPHVQTTHMGNIHFNQDQSTYGI